jgi:hypothetical protein
VAVCVNRETVTEFCGSVLPPSSGQITHVTLFELISGIVQEYTRIMLIDWGSELVQYNG